MARTGLLRETTAVRQLSQHLRAGNRVEARSRQVVLKVQTPLLLPRQHADQKDTATPQTATPQ